MKTKRIIVAILFALSMATILMVSVPSTLCKDVDDEEIIETTTHIEELKQETIEEIKIENNMETESTIEKEIELTTTESTTAETMTQIIEEAKPIEQETTVQTETKPAPKPNEKTETKPTVTTPVKENISLEEQQLIGSFGFYKGTLDMSKIETITFQTREPEKYDEIWNANIADTGRIKGYRHGKDVYIVGETIYANNRCSYMFAAKNRYDDALWSNLKEINGLEHLDMTYATKTNCMFYGSKIKELNGIKYWKTGNLKNTEMMFAECTELTELDIALWDVSNVTTFSGMFQGNSWAGDMKLKYLDVSKWNTSSATEMNHVFYGCAQLKEIPIDNWDVSKVTTFSHMFADCYSVENLNFSNWNTKSVQSFDALLNDCHALTVIDVSGLDTATCTQFSQMFEACINLEKIIGIETWDVSNASYYAFSETFHCCNKLKELDISNWKCKPDNIARMFANCFELKYVDMSGFDMSGLKYITEFAMSCRKLTEIVGIENWNIKRFDNWGEAFLYCPITVPN